MEKYKEHLSRGMLLWQAGKRIEATQELRKAVGVAPNNAETLYNLGVALQEQGFEDEAIQHFQSVIRYGSPDRVLISGAQNNLGVALVRRGLVGEAIEYYREAIHLDPLNSRAHNSLGMALGYQGWPEKALHEFKIVLQIDPNFKEARHYLEVTLRKLGKKQRKGCIMGFWNRLFGRMGRREYFEPTLYGGVKAIDPAKLMHEMLQLSEDVKKALEKNDPRLKRKVAARVDVMIERYQQFSELGKATFVPFMDNKTFARVEMSKAQQLASSTLPLLAKMKDDLNA